MKRLAKFSKLRTPEGSRLYRRLRTKDGVEVYASPFWYWKYKGKPHCTEQQDEQAALEWIRRHLIVHGRRDLSRPITWGEVEHMLLAKWRVSGRTEMVRKSKGIFKRIGSVIKPKDKLEDITPIHITNFKAERMDAGSANETINFDLMVIRRGFTLAHQAERLTRIPRIELLERGAFRTGTVSRDEWAALQGELRKPWLAVLQFLRGTGWRLNEGLRLTWDRVNLHGEPASVWLAAGRGADGTKTGKGRRIGLSPGVYALLEGREKERVNGERYVFGDGRAAGKPLHPSGLQREWQRACKVLGIKGRIIHDLRRSLISDMHAQGIPESVVRSIVGHETKFIHWLYVQTAEELQAEALGIVEQARAAGTKPTLGRRNTLRLVS